MKTNRRILITTTEVALVYFSICSNADLHHKIKVFETHMPFDCPTSLLKITNGKISVSTGPRAEVIVEPNFIKSLY